MNALMVLAVILLAIMIAIALGAGVMVWKMIIDEIRGR